MSVYFGSTKVSGGAVETTIEHTQTSVIIYKPEEEEENPMIELSSIAGQFDGGTFGDFLYSTNVISSVTTNAGNYSSAITISAGPCDGVNLVLAIPNVDVHYIGSTTAGLDSNLSDLTLTPAPLIDCDMVDPCAPRTTMRFVMTKLPLTVKTPNNSGTTATNRSALSALLSSDIYWCFVTDNLKVIPSHYVKKRTA